MFFLARLTAVISVVNAFQRSKQQRQRLHLTYLRKMQRLLLQV